MFFGGQKMKIIRPPPVSLPKHRAHSSEKNQHSRLSDLGRHQTHTHQRIKLGVQRNGTAGVLARALASSSRVPNENLSVDATNFSVPSFSRSAVPITALCSNQSQGSRSKHTSKNRSETSNFTIPKRTRWTPDESNGGSREILGNQSHGEHKEHDKVNDDYYNYSSIDVFGGPQVPSLVPTRPSSGRTTVSESNMEEPPSGIAFRKAWFSEFAEKDSRNRKKRGKASPSRKRAVARNIDKRSRARQRNFKNLRRDAYGITAKDGRLKSLSSTTGNGYNARPDSSSFSEPKDTWVAELPGAKSLSKFSRIGHGESQNRGNSSSRRRDPRSRRPFINVVEVHFTAEIEDKLQAWDEERRSEAVDILEAFDIDDKTLSLVKQGDFQLDSSVRVLLQHMILVGQDRGRDIARLSDFECETRISDSDITVVDELNCVEKWRVKREEQFMRQLSSAWTMTPSLSSSVAFNHTDEHEAQVHMNAIVEQVMMALATRQAAAKGALNRVMRHIETAPGYCTRRNAAGDSRRKVLDRIHRSMSARQIQLFFASYQMRRANSAALIVQSAWRCFARKKRSIYLKLYAIAQSLATQRLQRWWRAIRVVWLSRSWLRLQSNGKDICGNIVEEEAIYRQFLASQIISSAIGGNSDASNHLEDQALLLQCAWRSYIARKSVRNQKLAHMHLHRHKRREAWERRRGGRGDTVKRRDLVLAHRELLTWHTYVNFELKRVENEIKSEHRRLARAWQRWDAHMVKTILSKPLPSHIIPQVDKEPEPWVNSSKGGGWAKLLGNGDLGAEVSTSASNCTENNASEGAELEQQYLNLRTGKLTTEHPHMKEVKKLRVEQGERCRETLLKRVSQLQQYGEKLRNSLQEHQNALCKRLVLMKGVVLC